MISKRYNAQMGNYLEKLAKASKSQTNADRIRAMTDEELADFLMDVSIHGGIHIDGSITRWSIYEWLKKEVDDDRR